MLDLKKANEIVRKAKRETEIYRIKTCALCKKNSFDYNGDSKKNGYRIRKRIFECVIQKKPNFPCSPTIAKSIFENILCLGNRIENAIPKSRM